MNPLKLKILLPLFLLLLFVTPALSHPQPQAAATVLRIIDGDTLEIELQGKKESVRLIGIDCPESKANQKAKKDAERSGQDLKTITAMGKQATVFTKRLVKSGDRVKIEFDVQQRDKYRRLLGYVYLPDGRMLNEEVVKAGYASPATFPPNVKYEGRFLKVYREARENKRGLWREFPSFHKNETI